MAKRDNVDNEKLWSYRFLELSDTVASWSKDPSTKVGSVIVDSKRRVVSLGYNGFPRGVEDTPDRYNDRDTKLLLVCHAERNALDNAPTSVEGATLYATLFPCNECCKSIIQRGIKRVVSFVPPPAKQLLFNYEASYIMLREAGVEVHQLSRSLYDDWKNDDIKRETKSNAAGVSVQGDLYEERRQYSRDDVYSSRDISNPSRTHDGPCKDSF